MKIKRQGYSCNLMLKKIPYHIITEQKSIPIPAAHPCTANYRKLLPRGSAPIVGMLAHSRNAKINISACGAWKAENSDTIRKEKI